MTTSPVSLILMPEAKDLLYNTDLHYLKQTLLYGPILDLVNAELCAEDSKKHVVWAWLNSAAAFFTLACSSLVHLVHDIVMTILHAPSWFFSEEGKNTCKAYAYRCVLGVAGVLVGVAGTFVPKAAMWLAERFLFPNIDNDKANDVARYIRAAKREISHLDPLQELNKQFFAKA
jgi:hypothetical protein